MHFAPLHQLSSFVVFRYFGLNFDVALGLEAACWVAIIALGHQLLLRLVPRGTANILTLLFGASPLWLHTMMWWSAAAHRLPYLLLQLIVFLAYLDYREREKIGAVFIGILAQVLALGFFIKGILFPVSLVAFEICLAAQSKRFSRAGLTMCALMCAISSLYMGWYFGFAPVAPPNALAGMGSTLFWAAAYMSRLGSLLLFLPLDTPWSCWVSGIFWITVASWRISQHPITAIPIFTLLVLLIVNFAMSIWGRGFFITLPLSSFRYYSEIVVILVIFIALTLQPNRGVRDEIQGGAHQSSTSLSVYPLIIFFTIMSYFSNRHLLHQLYMGHMQTHIFMINAKKSLFLLEEKPNPKLMSADFPPFVFGYMGMRMPLEAIFGVLHPHIEWVPPNHAVIGSNIMQSDGRITAITSRDR